MASFDLSVPKHPSGEDLQRALLRWIQHAARDLDLKFRYRSQGQTFWAALDGSLPLMYGLRAYLVQDLPILAVARTTPTDRRQRLRIAAQLQDVFDEGLEQITEAVHEVGAMLGGVPNSIVFDYGGNSDLAPTLRSLTNTLVLDIQGRVSRKTTVEEVHTGLELLLRAVLGSRARLLSFAQMVDAVTDEGIIDRAQADDVKKLKDFRRDAKHRGKGFDEDEAWRLVRESVVVMQRLLVRVRAT